MPRRNWDAERPYVQVTECKRCGALNQSASHDCRECHAFLDGRRYDSEAHYRTEKEKPRHAGHPR